MATSSSSTSTASKTADLGQDAHDAEPGFHGHAPYPSAEDLETRLASARGLVPGAGLVTPDAPAPAADTPPSSR